MPDHDRHAIAHSGPCQIEQCDCGVLHVTVGMATLRLQPTTARALADALARALALTADTELVAIERARWND